MENVWAELETVKRRSRATTSNPEVTVQKAGSLGLNEAAVAALGHPNRVILLIRRDPPLLGIRPSGENPDAYTLQDNARGGVVNAVTAIASLGLDHSVARRYQAQEVEGGLLVDFTKEGLEVSPGRRKRSNGAEAG